MPHTLSSDIVSTVTSAIDLTKQLVELADAARDAEARLIADLQIQLAEFSVRLDGLVEVNTQLNEQLKQAASTEHARRARLAELITENSQLKEQLKQAASTEAELAKENKQLKEQLQQAADANIKLVVKNGRYFRTDGDGPFCLACYDNAQKLVRLSEMPPAFRSFGNWHCADCEANYD